MTILDNIPIQTIHLETALNVLRYGKSEDGSLIAVTGQVAPADRNNSDAYDHASLCNYAPSAGAADNDVAAAELASGHPDTLGVSGKCSSSLRQSRKLIENRTKKS